MELIDNINRLLGDDLKQTLKPGARLNIAATGIVNKLETYNGRILADSKRQGGADASRWVLSDYFATDWLLANRQRATMPVALHLGGLYEQLLHRLIPLPARPQETLAELVACVEQVQDRQRDLGRIQARLAREKQFNRKVAINAERRKLNMALNELKK